MSYTRKAVIIGSLGTARLFMKSNSKKERTADATEKQLKLEKKAAKQARKADRPS